MTNPTLPSWHWPILRVRPMLVLLGVGLGFGLLQGLAVGLSLRADGQTVPWSRPLFWEITGAMSAFALFFLPQAAVANAPSPKAGWLRFFRVHGCSFLAYTLLHIGLMMLIRYPLYRSFGWGTYNYGDLAFKVPMEMAKDVLGYLFFALGFKVFSVWKENQARSLREANLQAQLKEAQLQALTGNLDPHFLFNALNTISSVMYEDLPKTDALLSDLGLLLRASLEGGAAWSLGEERRHTERYAALLTARFGERFRLAWELDAGLETFKVPRFSLQLLVENAVKHNGNQDGSLQVRILGSRLDSGLRLRVEDNGVGFRPDADPGIGLATLRRGLELLFEAGAALEQGNLPQGGAWVEVRIGTEVRA